MIHIEKDASIVENPNLRVVTATGDYEDSALIEFIDVSNPEIVAGAFQAQYIRYGNLVYTCNSHKELGIEILKIDPESTHTAASYVRMMDELLVKMNNGSLEPESLDTAISVEQDKMQEKMEEPPEEVLPPEEIAEPVVEEVPTTEEPVTEETLPEEIPLEEIPPVDSEVPSETIPEEVPVIPVPESVPDTVPEETPSDTSGDAVVSVLKRKSKRRIA